MAANSNIPGAKNKSSPKSVDESFDSESLMSSWASEASPPYYKDHNIDPRLDKGFYETPRAVGSIANRRRNSLCPSFDDSVIADASVTSTISSSLSSSLSNMTEVESSPEVNRNSISSEKSLRKSLSLLTVQDVSHLERPSSLDDSTALLQELKSEVTIMMGHSRNDSTLSQGPVMMTCASCGTPSLSTRSILMPRMEIVFETTQVGFISRREFITLDNMSASDQEVYVQQIVGPFKTEMGIKRGSVKKDYGVRIPLTFNPVVAGFHSGSVMFSIKNSPEFLIFSLKGKAV